MARNAKQRLLEQAEILFLKYGWQRVTVDEICRKTGVTRKTFYTYYSNKDEIVFSVLKLVVEEMSEAYLRIFNNSGTNFAEKLKELEIFKLEYAQRMGMEFMNDMMLSKDERITAILAETEGWANAHFVEVFRKAKDNGEIRKDVNIDVIIAITTHLNPLYVQPEFQALFRNMSDMIEQVSNMICYGIFNKEK